MGERWPMNDDPPVNGQRGLDQRSQRRRPRPRSDDAYDSYDEEPSRSKRRHRPEDERGSYRNYNSEMQRGNRPHRHDSGGYDSQRGRAQRSDGPEAFRDEPRPPVGSMMRGSVHSVRPFGLLIVLPDYKRHGLVYHTQVSEGIAFDRDDDDDSKVKALNYYYPVGKQVWVKVVDVRMEYGMLKISCSMKAVSQVDGKDLDPDNVVGQKFQGLKEEPPNVGTTHKAVVQSVKSYGAFVRLEGYKSNGLVHSSQISDNLDIVREDSEDQKVAAIQAKVRTGDEVWVTVIDVKPGDRWGRGPKVGCSIKACDRNLSSGRESTDTFRRRSFTPASSDYSDRYSSHSSEERTPPRRRRPDRHSPAGAPTRGPPAEQLTAAALLAAQNAQQPASQQAALAPPAAADAASAPAVGAPAPASAVPSSIVSSIVTPNLATAPAAAAAPLAASASAPASAPAAQASAAQPAPLAMPAAATALEQPSLAAWPAPAADSASVQQPVFSQTVAAARSAQPVISGVKVGSLAEATQAPGQAHPAAHEQAQPGSAVPQPVAAVAPAAPAVAVSQPIAPSASAQAPAAAAPVKADPAAAVAGMMPAKEVKEIENVQQALAVLKKYQGIRKKDKKKKRSKKKRKSSKKSKKLSKPASSSSSASSSSESSSGSSGSDSD